MSPEASNGKRIAEIPAIFRRGASIAQGSIVEVIADGVRGILNVVPILSAPIRARNPLLPVWFGEGSFCHFS